MVSGGYLIKTRIILLTLRPLAASVFAAGRRDTSAELDRLLQKEMKSLSHGGIIFSLSRGEEVVFSRGDGMADEEKGVSMTPETPSSASAF